MINIRPVSDLRNKFVELENVIKESNSPIFLTKNGHGSMVLMSVEKYEELTNHVEKYLDEAEVFANSTTTRYSGEEVFSRVRERINAREEL